MFSNVLLWKHNQKFLLTAWLLYLSFILCLQVQFLIWTIGKYWTLLLALLVTSQGKNIVKMCVNMLECILYYIQALATNLRIKCNFIHKINFINIYMKVQTGICSFAEFNKIRSFCRHCPDMPLTWKCNFLAFCWLLK